MKKKLNMHDSQILRIVTNPLNASIQILVSKGLNVVLEIRIKNVVKILHNNINDINLFYFSAGGIDDCYIEEINDEKLLEISGIISHDCESIEEINWSFSIQAMEIEIINHVLSERDIDKFYDIEFMNSSYLLNN